MISAQDFLGHARLLVSSPVGNFADAIELRRAASAAYYALFHLLANAGAQTFAAGGVELVQQVSPAFSHTTMRKVCDAHVRSPLRPFPASLDHLHPHQPDKRLISISSTFAQLQEGRHSADYDLAAVFEPAYVDELVTLAEIAFSNFQRIQILPETQVFLTALLLSDRWTRRG